MTMKNTLLTCGVLACILTLAAPAFAQEMPAPRRMPRIPVSRETLSDQTPPAARAVQGPAARAVQGPAVIFDGERIRVGETDLRLFGIVPPQLAASFGPQARATLDALANGQSVSCLVRDRDHDGRLLATCRSASGSDMALELLRRGLAVTARGSITGTELAAPYLSAEQAAQAEKLGLWSVTLPSAPAFAAAAPTPPAATRVDTSVAAPAAAVKEDKMAARSDKITPAAETAAPAVAAAVTPPPSENQAKITADIVDQHTQADADEDSWQTNPDMGFFERYQILIASGLMLTTALSIIAALWGQKSRDKRDEIKAIAAALRGELMAARGVCIGRIKSITSEDEDHAAVWPRIRTTLYQAYVGRLGLLGAELARQVASIYGQSSDYAALYSPNGTAYDATKKGALESLSRHIDEVLPKLANIEQTGTTPTIAVYSQRPRSRYDAPAPMLRAEPPHTPTPGLQQSSYKTIGAPMEKLPKPPAYEQPAPYEEETLEATATPIPPAAPAAAAPAPVEEAIKPTALWETVRGFIQNHRNAIAQSSPHDEHISEYAAMIEADMARYPYNDSVESFDISQRKRG
jgi:endonuclease YncB( thermonuclease family)